MKHFWSDTAVLVLAAVALALFIFQGCSGTLTSRPQPTPTPIEVLPLPTPTIIYTPQPEPTIANDELILHLTSSPVLLTTDSLQTLTAVSASPSGIVDAELSNSEFGILLTPRGIGAAKVTVQIDDQAEHFVVAILK